jgi:uncharacterized protein with HEPN domain
MKRSYTEFLQDILDAITEISLFVNGVSYEAFESNREKTLAVVKLLKKFLMSAVNSIQIYLGNL